MASSTASENTSMEDVLVQNGPGRVSKLRQNWSVFEDEALAHRLQSEEIHVRNI